MKFKKSLLTGTAIVVAVLLIAPLLFPASLLIPHVQKAASEALQDHVEVAGARLAFFPAPHVTVHDVAVGKRPYLQIEKLSVTPRLGTLFTERKVLRKVELTGIVIRQPLFDKVDAITGTGDDGAHSVEVERLLLHGAQLHLDGVRLQGFEADVRFGPGNVPTSLVVHNFDRSLRISAAPKGDVYSIALKAANWRLPAGPSLDVTAMEAEGELSAHRLILPAVSGQFYGGALNGQFALTWTPDWQLAGHFVLQGVDLQPIAALYSKETAISGRLAAKGVIDLKAASAETLFAGRDVEIEFEVADGTLHRLDLAAAARLLPGKAEGKPGKTRFERFSGHLTIDPQGFHFTELKIASGVLNAQGFVSVSPQQELSGRIDTALKGTGSLVGTPLAVSGTVDSPKVRPTRGTLAGAAAGTLLLGPGVGTTIGMKAAELTERLFGKQPPKAKRVTAPVPATAPSVQSAGTPPDRTPVRADADRATIRR